MKNIIFVGVKHCGKSTQGRLLARRLQLPFADTDELIAQTYAAENGVPLADAQPRRIVQKHGEEFFRRLEADTILKMLDDSADNCRVIALGGGVLSNKFLSRDVLKKLGVLIYLNIDSQIAWERVAAGGIPPFLTGEDPQQKFLNLCRERSVILQAAADVIVDVPDRIGETDLSAMIYDVLKNNRMIL